MAERERRQLGELKGLFEQSRLSFAEADRRQYARDQSPYTADLPQVVAWPESTDEVSRLLEFANRAGIPVTAWGAGTSLEGNPLPVQGGITLDLRRMDKILAVHADDFQVSVQPGILYRDMNARLARQGLFFAPDPGANASIGGMLANNAAGIRTVRYGATRDNVLALEAVLAGGEVIRTGTRAVKQASGYDLTHLLVGSEGTLAVITEATLKLAPIPAWIGAATAAFPEVRATAEAVYELIGAGLGPSALELLDAQAIRIMNHEPDLTLADLPHLFLEFPATSQESLADLLDMAEAICRSHGCEDFVSGLGREARDRLWTARYRLFEAHQRVYAGQDYLLTDCCVPISKFPELVDAAAVRIAELGLQGSVVCHAGDGNMHTVVFFNRGDSEARQRALRLNEELIELALRLDGTLSGEHGIGIGKRAFMPAEHTQASLEVMRRVKAALDPRGILNPGKILPPSPAKGQDGAVASA